MSDWESTQNEVQACRRCEQQRVRYLRVPAGEKRNPPWEPLLPIRLYFVSVAPPWGGAYFWDETARDAVRDGIFRALRKPLLTDVTTCREFRDLHLFLTPAVKCPSAKTNNIQGGKDRDHPPSRTAVANCAELLRSEIMAANPERILALGAVPFRSLCDIFGIVAPGMWRGFAVGSGGFGSAIATYRSQARISPVTIGTGVSKRLLRTSIACSSCSRVHRMHNHRLDPERQPARFAR